jgi:SAM-dependent methyltransferase
MLDIGCGAGSALFGLARRARLAVGLDILLTDLLLAKKRFAEAGTANVTLVCASALELPFADECFGLANATDVIEHVPDQGRLLGEVRRVLRPGGLFFFNSPNRFTLVTREPHVKLWGVGWLPRRWMEPYVRWRLGKPYRSKRLLGLRELRRLVCSAFGPHFAVRSLLPRGRLARALLRPAEALARPLLPQHNVVAWKPERGAE